MARILTFGNYGIFVLSERGQRHHLPHAHIKHHGQRVASVFLLSLGLYDTVERVPSGLIAFIAEHQGELLAAWKELNGD